MSYGIAESELFKMPNDFILDYLNQEVRDLDICLIVERGYNTYEDELRPILIRFIKSDILTKYRINYYYSDDIVLPINPDSALTNSDKQLIKLHNPEFFLNNKEIAQLFALKISLEKSTL